MCNVYIERFKKLFLILFFITRINFDIICETKQSEKCGITNIVFYSLANKGLMPNVVYAKSLKYCDFYFGASNGLDLYIISKEKIKFGIFSFRHETLNMFFNTLVCKFDKNISFVYGMMDILSAFILGFYVSLINIKFGPISLNFIEFPIFSPLLPFDVKYVKEDSNGNKVGDDEKNKNAYTCYVIDFFMKIFFPSVKIDISQLIYNIKNKKSFFNTLYS